MVRFLLDNGANANAISAGYYGHTPLHQVVDKEENQLEIARMLLNSHANQSIKNECGDLPLHLACKKSQYDLIKVLVENCSGLLAIAGGDGWLPFHLACMDNAPLDTIYTLVRLDPNIMTSSLVETSSLYE